jgi:hypothetical protein
VTLLKPIDTPHRLFDDIHVNSSSLVDDKIVRTGPMSGKGNDMDGDHD